jgi:hypothetical protein
MAVLHNYALSNGQPDMVGAAQAYAVILALYAHNEDAAIRFWGFTSNGTRKAWVSAGDPWPPYWCLWQAGDQWYLYIDGTNNPLQWAGNVLGAVGMPYGVPPPYVHAFFYTVWTTQLRAAILAAAGGAWSGTWHIAGYSYGGALALIAGLDIAAALGPGAVDLITFAQPRAFTAGLTSPMPASYHRLARPADPVPQLPWSQAGLSLPPPLGLVSTMLPWFHYGTGWAIADSAPPAPWPNIETPWASAPGALGQTDPTQHSMNAYWQSVSTAAGLQAGSGPSSPDLNTALALATEALAPPGPPPAIDVLPSSYISPAVANAVYFAGSPALTPALLDAGVPTLATSLANIKVGIIGVHPMPNAPVEIFKVKLTYEFYNQGWTEIYYGAGDPAQLCNLSNSGLQYLMAPRPAGVKLLQVSAYHWADPRNGTAKPYDYKKPPFGNPATGGPFTADPTGVVAYARIASTNGPTRRIAPKCWADVMIARDVSGGSVLTADGLQALNLYGQFLTAPPAYGIAVRFPKSTTGYQAFSVKNVVAVSSGTSNLVLDPNDWAAWQQASTGWVVLGHPDKHNMPALKGIFPVISSVSPNILIQFGLPAGLQTYTPAKLTVRNLNYTFRPFTGAPKFREWRTTKVGRALGLSRGRGPKQLART